MKDEAIKTNTPIIAMITKKYIHDIAVAVSCADSEMFAMYFITTLLWLVKESIIVYIAFTSIIGLIIGKVIFQKVSQAVAPSILLAS